MKKIMTVLSVSAVLFGATACLGDDTSNPTVESDSDQSYKDSPTIPTDTAVYEINGKVIGQVNSVTRQTSAGGGSTPTCFGTSGCYGGGSFFGPVSEGKGYVRLLVTAPTKTDLAPMGEVTLLKVTDTKATALIEGDQVLFKCRRQYEAIAAVQENEPFNKTTMGTWELDYCRLATPVIQKER